MAETAPAAGGMAAFRFTGRAEEYFRIWIVNVCLSIITLGIYSAWAKVRRKRYFYGNTLLNEAAFDYLADPKAIFRGRLIVAVGVVAWSIVGETRLAWLQLLLAVVLLALLPKIIIIAARFNAVYSEHRGVRFGFEAGYGETALSVVLPAVLIPFTLGLLYPYYVYCKRKYIMNHSSFGATPFEFEADSADYYLAFFKASWLMVLLVIGSIVTLGIAALPLYFLFAAYKDQAIGRLNWSNTRLGELRFECRWTTGGLFKLYFLNSLAVMFTLGLLAPWAAIRTARYQLEGIAVGPAEQISGFLAEAQEQASALGGEAFEMLGFDFGL
jgi:uncharacterized membrane protein YjgN (DUF898 family)